MTCSRSWVVQRSSVFALRGSQSVGHVGRWAVIENERYFCGIWMTFQCCFEFNVPFGGEHRLCDNSRWVSELVRGVVSEVHLLSANSLVCDKASQCRSEGQFPITEWVSIPYRHMIQCVSVLIVRSVSSDNNKQRRSLRVTFVIEIHVCRHSSQDLRIGTAVGWNASKTAVKLLLPCLPGLPEDRFVSYMFNKYTLNASVFWTDGRTYLLRFLVACGR
jgi:hypothetical protein